MYTPAYPNSRVASRCNQESGSSRWPQEARNDRKPLLLPTVYRFNTADTNTVPKKKKSRREGSAKASPLPPPIELIKTLLCCHGCVDQLREGSSVQQEPRQVGLNVHKAREQRHEKFELSMKGKQCQQRRRHGHSSTILNVCNRQIKRRGKS